MGVIVPNLRGIIVRDDDDSIIVRATPAEVKAFTSKAKRGQEVNVKPASLRMRVGHVPRETWDENTQPTAAELRGGDLLYNAAGQPVATIQEVIMSSNPIRVTTLGGMVDTFIQGRYYVDIRAEGLPGLRVR